MELTPRVRPRIGNRKKLMISLVNMGSQLSQALFQAPEEEELFTEIGQLGQNREVVTSQIVSIQVVVLQEDFNRLHRRHREQVTS